MKRNVKIGVLFLTVMLAFCFFFVPATSLAQTVPEDVDITTGPEPESAQTQQASQEELPSEAKETQMPSSEPSASATPSDAESGLAVTDVPQNFALFAGARAADPTIIQLFPDTEFAYKISRVLYKNSINDTITQDELDSITELGLPDTVRDLTGISHLTKLETLNIMYNKNLQTLPAEIGSLANLQKLNVSACSLTSLPAEIGNLRSLQRLDLQNNSLTSLPAEVENLSSLKKLDLLKNKMERFPVEICRIPNLTELILSECGLQNIPAEIGTMEQLEILWIDENQIREIPKEIGNLKNLKTLVLRDNLISSVPEEFGELESLEGINLENNLLERVPDAITKPAGLTFISLNGNSLTELPAGIGKLQHLNALHVYDNELTELPAEIYDCPSLTRINAFQNRIQELPEDIGKLRNLFSLDIGQNELQYLPDAIGTFSELRVLDVDDNHIASLPDTIKNLAQCYELSANNNDLTELPEVIAAMPKLDKLYVSGNHLADVSMVPKKLTKFEAHNQEITIRAYKKEITLPCTYSVGGVILWDRGYQQNEMKSNEFYKNGAFHLPTNPAGGKLEGKSGNFSINYTIDLRDKLFVDLGVTQIDLSVGELYTLTPTSDVLDGYEVEYTCTSSDGWKTFGFLPPDAVLGMKEGMGYLTMEAKVIGTSITGKTTVPVFVAPEKPATQGTVYPVLEGGGQTLSADATELAFRIDAPISKFVHAWIDKTRLLKDLDYTLREGSTIITLKESALRELADGTHTLTLEFEDGYAQIEFLVDKTQAESTVNKGAQDDDGGRKIAPKTGDGAPSGMSALAVLSGVMLVVALRKKWMTRPQR